MVLSTSWEVKGTRIIDGYEMRKEESTNEMKGRRRNQSSVVETEKGKEKSPLNAVEKQDKTMELSSSLVSEGHWPTLIMPVQVSYA